MVSGHDTYHRMMDTVLAVDHDKQVMEWGGGKQEANARLPKGLEPGEQQRVLRLDWRLVLPVPLPVRNGVAFECLLGRSEPPASLG